MASLNRVHLIGNLTRDPEIRYLPSGDPVGDLRLAVNRRYRTRQGEDKEETVFVSVAVFGRQAEPCGKYLHRGSPVLVEGRLRYEEWERDGQRHNRLSVTAERVQFLNPPRDSQYGDAPRERAAEPKERAAEPKERAAEPKERAAEPRERAAEPRGASDMGASGGVDRPSPQPDAQDEMDDEDNIPF